MLRDSLAQHPGAHQLRLDRNPLFEAQPLQRRVKRSAIDLVESVNAMLRQQMRRGSGQGLAAGGDRAVRLGTQLTDLRLGRLQLELKFSKSR